MEAEARAILEAALAAPEPEAPDLASFARGLFAPLGGVELELPPREPGREPPDFSTGAEEAPVIVLDTNLLAELTKPEADAAVLAWVARQRRAELCTTAISEAERAYGLARLPRGRRRDALAQAMARLLGEGLGGRVLAFDRAAAAGHPVATADGQIAAIARARGAALLATRDTSGFWEGGVPVLDPWRA
jgi:predicted nucleic acid-binding protein